MKKLGFDELILFSRIWDKLNIDVDLIDFETITKKKSVSILAASIWKAEDEIKELIKNTSGKDATKMSVLQIYNYVYNLICSEPLVKSFFLLQKTLKKKK